MTKTTHIYLSISGALTNWTDRDSRALCRYSDGRLVIKLAKGHEVVPAKMENEEPESEPT